MERTGNLETARQVERLVARAGDLKSELVAFAQGPRFVRRLEAWLDAAADEQGFLDEATAIAVIDHFALQHRLSDGSTVVERFVAQHQPVLAEDERSMLLGWQDVVEGVFEVQRREGSAVLLHNLLDDLVYTVYSNMGRRALRNLRKGMFVVARVVPVLPDADAWLVSGSLSVYPSFDGPELAQEAVETLTANPQLLRRNPEMMQRSWEMQAEARADFVELFGCDLLVLEPHEAQSRLREYHRHRLEKAVAALPAADGARAMTAGPSLDDLSALPEDLLTAETVALVCDETEGLAYYADFGRLDALFADPALARQSGYLAQLREYLNDDSISPMVIRRLAQRHPEGADTVFRRLLRKPSFTWDEHGEELLRRRKKSHYRSEPLPSVTLVGARLAELLRAGR
ncbi:hypothetical protein [Streptomyces violascens]|uniref:hypothetical protein n=1 Tax=Streptomyces violascens TaxID=67381 RepID=UPI0036C3D9A4